MISFAIPITNILKGKKSFSIPVDIEVSQASSLARGRIEAAGGSLKTMDYSRLGLRHLLKVYLLFSLLTLNSHTNFTLHQSEHLHLQLYVNSMMTGAMTWIF